MRSPSTWPADPAPTRDKRSQRDGPRTMVKRHIWKRKSLKLVGFVQGARRSHVDDRPAHLGRSHRDAIPDAPLQSQRGQAGVKSPSTRYSHDGRYWPIAVDQDRGVEADYNNASADIRS